MAARKKAPEPEPVDDPRDASETPDDGAIEADVIQETPTPYDRRIEQVSTRTESYIVPAPIKDDVQPAAAAPAQSMAEELREDISPVDELLDDLGPENGAAVYIYRMPDLMRKRFRNPCNEKTFMGQITVDREHKTRALIEIETQRQFGGGYYLFDLRYGERNSIKGKWMQTIADPPWSNADATPSAQGSAIPAAPSVAPKSLNQELRELRETSELLGWGPVRPQASQQVDPLQTVQQTVGMISGVAEAIKILQPEAALPAGAGWKDMVVQLGPMIMPELKGLLSAAMSRLSAPAMAPPRFNGGMPHAAAPSQFQPPPMPQVATANGAPAMPDLPPEMQRELARNTAIQEFLGNVVVGLKHGEDQGFAMVILTRSCRVFPELIPQMLVTLRQTPAETLGQLSFLVEEDLSAYPGALEWIEVLQGDLLEQEIFQGAGSQEPGEEDSEGFGVAAPEGLPNDGLGGPSESSLTDGPAKNAPAEPVFTLQEGAGSQEPGVGEKLGRNDYDFSDETVKELYGGTDDDE